MPAPLAPALIDDGFIKSRIHTIRGVQVMLDRDLAVIYGVETKALNQAVKRNAERFPESFMFRLSFVESEKWKSQIVTSNLTPKEEPGLRMGLRRPPYAFTEQGIAMLSAVCPGCTESRSDNGRIWKCALPRPAACGAVATAAGGVVESGASGTETAPPAPMSPFVASLSPHLFWDVDREQVDPENHRGYIVQRVTERGSMDDWRRLRSHYGLETIVKEAQGLRSLEPTALAFLSTVGHVPEESFRCYAWKQSLPELWP